MLFLAPLNQDITKQHCLESVLSFPPPRPRLSPQGTTARGPETTVMEEHAMSRRHIWNCYDISKMMKASRGLYTKLGGIEAFVGRDTCRSEACQ